MSANSKSLKEVPKKTKIAKKRAINVVGNVKQIRPDLYKIDPRTDSALLKDHAQFYLGGDSESEDSTFSLLTESDVDNAIIYGSFARFLFLPGVVPEPTEIDILVSLKDDKAVTYFNNLIQAAFDVRKTKLSEVFEDTRYEVRLTKDSPFVFDIFFLDINHMSLHEYVMRSTFLFQRFYINLKDLSVRWDEQRFGGGVPGLKSLHEHIVQKVAMLPKSDIDPANSNRNFKILNDEANSLRHSLKLVASGWKLI